MLLAWLLFSQLDTASARCWSVINNRKVRRARLSFNTHPRRFNGRQHAGNLLKPLLSGLIEERGFALNPLHAIADR
jgi:hypothetical protein